MAQVFDILLDADLKMQIAGGDIVVGESTQQHQRLLLLSMPGEWRQWPTAGVGLRNYLLDDGTKSDLKSAIQTEFEKDGMQISRLRIGNNYQLELEASYG